jgi:hypothetical protein
MLKHRRGFSTPRGTGIRDPKGGFPSSPAVLRDSQGRDTCDAFTAAELSNAVLQRQKLSPRLAPTGAIPIRWAVTAGWEPSAFVT